MKKILIGVVIIVIIIVAIGFGPFFGETEYKTDGNVGELCQSSKDCQTPVSFLIQSNCPFGSACVDGRCAVVCPITFHDAEISVSHTPTCSIDTECDCIERENRTIECRCIDNSCVSVEAK